MIWLTLSSVLNISIHFIRSPWPEIQENYNLKLLAVCLRIDRSLHLEVCTCRKNVVDNNIKMIIHMQSIIPHFQSLLTEIKKLHTILEVSWKWYSNWVLKNTIQNQILTINWMNLLNYHKRLLVYSVDCAIEVDVIKGDKIK